jgi:hypothetical protein
VGLSVSFTLVMSLCFQLIAPSCKAQPFRLACIRSTNYVRTMTKCDLITAVQCAKCQVLAAEVAPGEFENANTTGNPQFKATKLGSWDVVRGSTRACATTIDRIIFNLRWRQHWGSGVWLHNGIVYPRRSFAVSRSFQHINSKLPWIRHITG